MTDPVRAAIREAQNRALVGDLFQTRDDLFWSELTKRMGEAVEAREQANQTAKGGE